MPTSTSSRPTSSGCSTPSRGATTSPTTCSRWGRTGAGAGPWSTPWTPKPGEKVLDLAAGTGTSSEPFAAQGAVVVPCDFSLGMLRGRQARPAGPAVHRRRRDPAAVRGRHLRRGDDLLRAAQRRRPARRPARDAPGDPPRRPARGLRVQPPDVRAVPHGVPRVPDEGAARHRPRRLVLARRLRLPRRVHPRLARPARVWPRCSPTPAGARPSGATSPAASSPSTAPPPEPPARVAPPVPASCAPGTGAAPRNRRVAPPVPASCASSTRPSYRGATGMTGGATRMYRRRDSAIYDTCLCVKCAGQGAWIGRGTPARVERPRGS